MGFLTLTLTFLQNLKCLNLKWPSRAECERCGAEETTEHLLRDCPSSQSAWKNLNSILEDRNLRLDKIVFRERVFDFGGTARATLIKLIIINEFIQIEIPKHLAESKIYTLINQLRIQRNILQLKTKNLNTLKSGGNLSFKIKV